MTYFPLCKQDFAWFIMAEQAAITFYRPQSTEIFFFGWGESPSRYQQILDLLTSLIM